MKVLFPCGNVSPWMSLAFLLAGSACAPEPSDAPAEPETYEAAGTVISVEGEHVLIDHEDIPGLMDAMTMTFAVSDPALLDGLESGTKVSFRIVVDGASYTIEHIEPRE